MSKELIERLCGSPKDTAVGRLDHEAAERIEELERELERERVRLAACGVVAMANPPDSATTARKMLPEYCSASLNDVIRAVDSELALRQERDALLADNERLRVCLGEAVAVLDRLRTLPYAKYHGVQARDGAMINIKPAIDFFNEVISATPAQGLARIRNQVLEEIAQLSDSFSYMSGNGLAGVIRAMKEPE